MVLKVIIEDDLSRFECSENTLFPEMERIRHPEETVEFVSNSYITADRVN